MPLTGLHGDAAAVGSSLDRLAERNAGPIVLVGHSYGGAVITHAATGRNDVGHLVYVAAFALDDGESVMGALGSFERRNVDLAAAMNPSDDGQSTVLDAALAPAALYGSAADPGIAAAAVQRLSPQPISTMTEQVEGAPRDRIASTYVVCTQDRAVHPDHQAVMAARCANRVDLDTDHSPFLSAVTSLADIVEAASRAVAHEAGA